MFNYNPYYQRYQPMEYQQSYPQNPQVYQQTYPQTSIGLQGKLVDSIQTARNMDIPLDGSISYYPTTDGSTIVAKQLMKDGSSKITIYKPSETNEDLITGDFKNDETNYIKEELKSIKTQIRELGDRLKGVVVNESNGDTTEPNV